MLKSKKSKIYLLTVLTILMVVLIVPQPANAGIGGWLITTVIGPICLWIIDFLGSLLITLITILVGVAQYNDFLNSPAVSKGWIILRDLCNMFFIVILLVIAFATVLGSEKYNYKKYLLPLILMAVLINFSKMIAGIFIDISQVVMLQFVNGFKYAAAGNFISSFGLNDLLSLRQAGDELATQMDSKVLVSLMLAVCMLVVSVVVTAIIVIVFLLRIIALWILVMLSPIAYVAQATPGGSSYANMWWSSFTKYCISGPVLAFFLWIALAIMAVNPTNVSETTNLSVGTEGDKVGIRDVYNEPAETVSIGVSEAGDSNRLLSFGISIGLLIGALMATQKLGVAGSNLAMAAKGKLETAGKRFAKVGLGIGAAAGTPWGLAALGYGVAKRAPDTATLGLARSDRLQNALARVSGARGVGGLILAGTGIMPLATKAYTSLKGVSKRKSEEAEKYIKNIGDMRILRRMSTQLIITPTQAAVKNAILEKSPSAVGWDASGRGNHDTPRIQGAYERLDRDAINKLSTNEWFRYGASGIDLTQNSYADELLSDNRRGKAERGAIARGLNEVGGVMPPAYAAQTASPFTPSGWKPENHYGDALTRQMAPKEEIQEEREEKNIQFSATKARLSEYKAQGKTPQDFYASPEYETNKKNYLTQEEFTRLESVKPKEMAVEAGAVSIEADETEVDETKAIDQQAQAQIPDTITGVNKLLGETADQVSARLALNFDKFGLSGPGANVIGEDKDKKTDEIIAALREEGGRSDEDITKIEQALKSAPSLQLINKDRKNPRQVISHEASHDYVDSLEPERREEILNRADKEILNKERQRIRDTWQNGDKMTDQDVNNEVLANMLTNESTHGNKQGIRLDQETSQELQEEDLHDGKNFKPLRAEKRARQDEPVELEPSEIEPSAITAPEPESEFEQEVEEPPFPEIPPVIKAEINADELAEKIAAALDTGDFNQVANSIEGLRGSLASQAKKSDKQTAESLSGVTGRLDDLRFAAKETKDKKGLEARALAEEVDDLVKSLKQTNDDTE